MEESPQDAITEVTIVHVNEDPTVSEVEPSIDEQQDAGDQPLTAVRALLEIAAQEEEPARSCGPFVALFGFEGVVDEAYQG